MKKLRRRKPRKCMGKCLLLLHVFALAAVAALVFGCLSKEDGCCR